MSLHLIRNDITRVQVDAIVNAANETLLGGGGVDGAIHAAAGPQLVAECRRLHGCRTGEAKITGAYNLPAKYVIHTVGPVWQGGGNHEEALLTSCYTSSLQLAVEHGCKSIAFPLISAGVYGYPKHAALEVAMQAIRAFLREHELDVTIVLFDKKAFAAGEVLFPGLKEYIDDHYVEEHGDDERITNMRRSMAARHSFMLRGAAGSFAAPSWNKASRESSREAEESPKALALEESCDAVYSYKAPSRAASLDDALQSIDESFSQMLMRKIDEAGIKDSECYKLANVDRKLFSKIRSDIHYHPRKQTALAFAIALRLNLEETKDMLQKAGYALSHASKFDIIVEYFIQIKEYDIDRINEALFAYDQQLLG